MKGELACAAAICTMRASARRCMRPRCPARNSGCTASAARTRSSAPPARAGGRPGARAGRGRAKASVQGKRRQQWCTLCCSMAACTPAALCVLWPPLYQPCASHSSAGHPCRPWTAHGELAAQEQRPVTTGSLLQAPATQLAAHVPRPVRLTHPALLPRWGGPGAAVQVPSCPLPPGAAEGARGSE